MSGPKNVSSEATYTGRLPLDSRQDIGRYLNDVKDMWPIMKIYRTPENFNFESA